MSSDTNNPLGDGFNEAMRVSLEQAYQSQQYEDYIYEALLGIPVLSLWDVCSLAAIDMLNQCTIPNCIKGLDWDAINKINQDEAEQGPNENTIIVLEPVQQWLLEQIVKSINEKEVQPQVIGRFFDGLIDAKRTYIDIQQIDNWLSCRGLNSKDENEYTQDCVSDSLMRLFKFIRNESSFLRAKVHKPDIEISVENKDFDDYFMENARLKLELKKATNRGQRYRVEPNGHEERHAKNREQLLGAALSVITQWPNQCQNSSAKYEATKIAKLIDEKSLLFWPTTGEPPLSREKIERELSKWINRIGK